MDLTWSYTHPIVMSLNFGDYVTSESLGLWRNGVVETSRREAVQAVMGRKMSLWKTY